MSQTHYTSDEVTRRGQAIYDQQIRNTLAADDMGKYLVLDVETGEYEVDASDVAALKRAKAKHPAGRFYIIRTGSSAAYRLGRRDVALGS